MEKNISITKNQIYQLEITGMTSEGSGVCKLEGFAIFVPDTAIGDVCKIKILKVNTSYGFGKVEEIVKPSPYRIAVDCDKFEQCGGCSYRHISYEQELLVKQELVENAFRRIGDIDIKVNPIIGSQNQSGYRNKAQYPVGVNSDGKVISGFFAKRSHRIVAKRSCNLQPDFFADIQHEIVDFLQQNQISIYDEESNRGLIRHIYLRYAQMTGEVMVCLVSTSYEIPKIKELIKNITVKFDCVKSIIINVNSQKTNVILGEHCKTIFGQDFIIDIICGIKVKISALSFYQVNRHQAEILYSKAIDYAQLNDSDTLLDLYCGTGTIGLSAASKVKSLIGVEIIPQAIENANENALLNGITNAKFICSDAGKAAQMLADNGQAPNVIIVDPPRKGLELDVIDAIDKMAPSRLVMISCNPATAARDCKLLVENGFEVKSITPVDMFPRTTHVECVVKLCRVEK